MSKKKESPRCSICADKNRCQIDIEYTKTHDQRGTARKFKVSEDALWRHINKGHISEVAKSVVAEGEKEHGLNIQACAKEIYDLCLRGAKKAESQDLRALGSCVAPAVKVLEILNKGNDDLTKGRSAIIAFVENEKLK